MEFFATLEKILSLSNPYDKIAQFRSFFQSFKTGNLVMDHSKETQVFQEPSYASYCKIVDPVRVPKRSKLGTSKGRAILLHAIAHIEYSAIDLAIDAAYRFKNMPMQYYQDWLEVADDECRHFLMIDDLLQELGYKYGDFEVHQGLFDAACATLTLLDRMAVVPRYLEANGLDANPKIIHKLSRFDDDFAKKMVAALEVILKEEVNHVKKGDRWFLWACEKEGIADPVRTYFEIVERIYPGTIHSKDFVNVEARKMAGFRCEEIKLLSSKNISC